MHHYIKNILAGVSVLSQLSILLVLVFAHGATAETDSLFIALTVSSILQLLAMMPYDQFIVYFNKVGKQSEQDANNFYIKVLIISALFGLLLTVVSELTVWVLSYFLEAFDVRDFLEQGVIHGFLAGLLAHSVLGLNDRYFNARGEIVTSYLILLIPQIAILTGILGWTFVDIFELKAVGYIYALFVWAGAIVTTFFILKSVKITNDYRFSGIRDFIVDSVMMRVGHNIYAISFQFFTNLFLIGMAEGIVSFFNYAYRAVIAIFSVAVSPANRVLMFKMSILAANKSMHEHTESSKKYLGECIPLFLFFVFMVILAGALVLWLDTPIIHQYLKIELDTFIFIFTLISLWQFIVILESVYVGVIISLSKYRAFIVVNSIFAFMYISLGFIVKDYGQIYLLILVGMLSQLMSFVMYRMVSNKLLGINSARR